MSTVVSKTPIILNKKQLVHNGRTARNRRARWLSLHALDCGLSAVDPYASVRSNVLLLGRRLCCKDISISLSHFKKIVLIAVGKASAGMITAAFEILRDTATLHGIAVIPRKDVSSRIPERVEVFRTAHPIPDRVGLLASRRVSSVLRAMGSHDLLICMISGGASALLPSPAPGIKLPDLQALTKLLLTNNMTIQEINTVRRHVSELKGGNLVKTCGAGMILSLVISDVPGNNLSDIGSGLTAEDSTTFRDALEILRKRRLWNATPPRVRRHIIKGTRGEIADTPKPGDLAFQKVHNTILADNRTACEGVQHALRSNGLEARILTSSAEMDAMTMGKFLAATAIESKQHHAVSGLPQSIIIGGETTVEVTGKGIGGRNQEAALSAASKIERLDGVTVAAFGTDGIDGNSEAAGAIVDGETLIRARSKHMSPDYFLAKNDSHAFFKRLGDILYTGPTGTNVGDIYLTISLD